MADLEILEPEFNASSRRNNANWQDTSGSLVYYEKHSSSARQVPGFIFLIPSTANINDYDAVEMDWYINQFGGWSTSGATYKITDRSTDFNFATGERPYQVYDSSGATEHSFSSTFPASGLNDPISIDYDDIKTIVDANGSHGTNGTHICIIFQPEIASSEGGMQVQSKNGTNSPVLRLVEATVSDQDIFPTAYENTNTFGTPWARDPEAPVAVTNLTAGTGSSSFSASANISPDVNEGILIATVSCARASGSTEPLTDDMVVAGLGATWTKLAHEEYGFRRAAQIWVGEGANSSGTVLFNFTGNNFAEWGWSIDQVTGVDDTTPYSGVASLGTESGSTSETITVADTPGLSDATYSSAIAEQDTSVTPEAGWTELGSFTGGTDVRAGESAWDADADTGHTWTFGSSTMSAAFALTLQAANVASGDQDVEPTGYSNSNTFGSLTAANVVSVTGFDNGNTFGVPTVEIAVSPTGFDNSNTFGTVAIDQTLPVSGYDNTNIFGTAKPPPPPISEDSTALVGDALVGTALVGSIPDEVQLPSTVTATFGGGALPEGWSFDQNSAANAVLDNSGDTAAITIPAGTISDGIFSVGSPDNTSGLTHAISGDFDVAVRFASVMTTDNSSDIGFVLTGATDADKIRFSIYSAGRVSNQYGYARVGGSGTNYQAPAQINISDWLQTHPTWLRVVRTGTTFTFYGSGDGSVWTQFTSVTGAYSPQTLKVHVGQYADAIGATVRVDQTVDLGDLETTDARGDAPTYYEGITVSSDLTTLPSWIDLDSEGSGSASHAAGEITLSTATADGSSGKLSFQGNGYDDAGVLMSWWVENATGVPFLAIGLQANDGTDGLDVYSDGPNYLHEIQAAGVQGKQVAVRTTRPYGTQVGFDEPYGYLGPNSTPFGVVTKQWSRVEKIGSRLRMRRWLDTDSEPTTWDYDGVEDTLRGVSSNGYTPYAVMGHNPGDSSTGDLIIDSVEFYEISTEPVEVINPSAYANTNSFGVASVTTDLAVTAFQNTNQFGLTQIDQEVGSAALLNANTFGTVITDHIISSTALENSSTFGTISVSGTVMVTGLQNANTFGTPAIDHIIFPSGYVNTNQFGVHGGAEDQTIYPLAYQQWAAGTYDSGTYNAGTFDSPTASSQFGSISIDQTAPLVGYTNANTFGTPSTDTTVQPIGYTNANTFGVPSTDTTVQLASYINGNIFGTPSINHEISVAGLDSPNQILSPTIDDTQFRQTTGDFNTNTFGAPFITNIYDATAFQNVSQILGPQSYFQDIPMSGFENTNTFGTPAFTEPLIPVPHQNQSTFGSVFITQDLTVDGYENSNTFGVTQFAGKVFPIRFQNTNTFGTPAFPQDIEVTGFQNTNTFGIADATSALEITALTNGNTFGAIAIDQTLLLNAVNNSNEFGLVWIPGAKDDDFFFFIVATY